MYWRGSAEVDWCEFNYVHNNYIAEFFNTLSSVPLAILPIVGLYYNKEYAEFVNPNVKYIYYLFIFVGLSSAYFHATLSLLGQLLDELGLLWVGILSYMVWFPRMRSTPKFVKNHARSVSLALLVFALVSSVLTLAQPSINAYLLMLLSIPTLVNIAVELTLTHDPTANSVGVLVVVCWALGVSVWISDRTMCKYWQDIGFPYFHAIWHCLSAYASYCAIILFSYLDATLNAPLMQPEMRYIPRNYYFRVPYLSLTVAA